MSTVITPPPQTLVPVLGSDATFPVGRIFCVGRNYAAHAREMGHDPDREPPFFFAKWADAVVPTGSTIAYPAATQDLHHEIELVVAIGAGGTDIAAERALGHVWGYGVGLDMTRRDIQAEAKKLARPWTMAKSFDQSAPLSPLRPAAEIGHPSAGAIWAPCQDAGLAAQHDQRSGLGGDIEPEREPEQSRTGSASGSGAISPPSPGPWPRWGGQARAVARSEEGAYSDVRNRRATQSTARDRPPPFKDGTSISAYQRAASPGASPLATGEALAVRR